MKEAFSIERIPFFFIHVNPLSESKLHLPKSSAVIFIIQVIMNGPCWMERFPHLMAALLHGIAATARYASHPQNHILLQICFNHSNPLAVWPWKNFKLLHHCTHFCLLLPIGAKWHHHPFKNNKHLFLYFSGGLFAHYCKIIKPLNVYFKLHLLIVCRDAIFFSAG